MMIFSRNPLQLTIYKDNGGDENVEFGEASITMSGPVGFTDAIAHHFYENSKNPYLKCAERTVEVISSNDGLTVVGNITVRLKLTCHGLETEQEVVPISVMPDRRQLQPISIEPFDFQFNRLIEQPPPKMMYNDVPKNKIEMLNAEKKGKFLYCQRYRAIRIVVVVVIRIIVHTHTQIFFYIEEIGING